MIYEKVTISLQRYNELMLKSDFFDSNYVAANFDFINDTKTQLWIKDDIIKEVEDYHRSAVVSYKNKIRSRCTLRFWRWKLSLKINK
jgi:hypothetical protein